MDNYTNKIQLVLIASGFLEPAENGMHLTDKGYKRAYDIWMKQSDEDKMLLGAFVVKILNRSE